MLHLLERQMRCECRRHFQLGQLEACYKTCILHRISHQWDLINRLKYTEPEALKMLSFYGVSSASAEQSLEALANGQRPSNSYTHVKQGFFAAQDNFCYNKSQQE